LYPRQLGGSVGVCSHFATFIQFVGDPAELLSSQKNHEQ
jgi:hypothetical protein